MSQCTELFLAWASDKGVTPSREGIGSSVLLLVNAYASTLHLAVNTAVFTFARAWKSYCPGYSNCRQRTFKYSCKWQRSPGYKWFCCIPLVSLFWFVPVMVSSPAPVGGTSLQSDFALYVCFAMLYGFLFPPMMLQAFTRRSQTALLFGTTAFSIERSAS